MLYRHFISNTYTCTSLGQHVQLLYAIGSLSFRTLPLMDAFPQIIKIILLYPQKPLFYMLLHVKTTGADKSHGSTIAYIPHIQHRHTTIDLSTRHRLLQQKSLPLFHTFSLSSRHTHVTHVTRTTDPFNARTMHSHLTYFPSSVTSTSILEHTPHIRPTHSFTSAIPQKRPFLPTLTLIADLPPRVVLPWLCLDSYNAYGPCLVAQQCCNIS